MSEIKMKIAEQSVYVIELSFEGFEFDSLARWDSERDAKEVKERLEQKLSAKTAEGEK